MNDAAKQILTAVAAATAATLVTGLLTHYLTKASTIESIANGTTTLPEGATPKTSSVTPQGSTPSPDPQPQPQPQPGPLNAQLESLAVAAQQLGWAGTAWNQLKAQQQANL